MVFHLDLWFERYHPLKQHISAKPVRVLPLSFGNNFLNPWSTTEKEFLWMERSLQYLKWVLNGIQFYHLHQNI